MGADFSHPDIERTCNLCGENKFHTIERSPAHLVICENCSLIFIKDIKEAGFYRELYAKHYTSEANAWKSACPGKRNIKYAEWIKKRLGAANSPRLLEIGCGSGSLLELLKKEGFDVYGIEPSEHAAEYARTKRGLASVENAFLEESGMPDNFFDVILLVQTFEHFMNPAESLFKIRSLLKDGGLLFIEVPDAFSIGGVYRWAMSPSLNHLYIYSALTIKLLLNKCGFEASGLKRSNINLRVIAKKGEVLNPRFQKYKNHYRKFLFINCINKSLLGIIFKLRLAERILKSRAIGKLLRLTD